MSDAAAAGDVAIDPKAPFTPGLAGLDRYCRRDAQWANLGLLFDDAFSNTASAPKKVIVIVMPRWGFWLAPFVSKPSNKCRHLAVKIK